MSAAKLWYYCDSSGQQQGPVAEKDLITEYNAGNLKDEHLVWSESLPDWTPFSQVGEIYAQIQQAKAKSLPPSKVSAAAPRFGMGAPAKPNLVDEIAKKSMESLQQQKTKPTAKSNAWTKVVGADGYPYYTNNETHETTWDRPDGYLSDEEVLQEQQPKPDVRQLSAKSTAAKTASTVPAGSSSSTGELADLKAMLVSLKTDLEQTCGALKDSMKANEKTQQDRMQAQEKLIADLKAEIASCKSELKEAKAQVSDYQKTLGTIQSSVKSASDSVSDLKTSTQNQFKQIKSFAKSLADNIKE